MNIIQKLKQLCCKHFYMYYSKKFKISGDKEIVSLGDLYKYCIQCNKTKIVKLR